MTELREERKRTIEKMYKMANGLVENYSWEANCKLWDMAYEWNGNHDEEDEIFMCEIYREDGYDADGFMIEDDYWYFKD